MTTFSNNITLHAVTSPLKENSMGGNVTTPKQASVACCQLALAVGLPHGFVS